MTEQMTTDQRVALALVTTMQATAAVVQTFTAVVDDTELGKLAQRQVDAQDANGERLLELSEALAAGNVRIVDEGALVHEVARLITPVGGEWEKNISAAQGIVLRVWKTTGVLR